MASGRAHWWIEAERRVREHGPVEYVDVPLQRWSRSELIQEVERLRDALVRMDEAVCHGSPETAKRIARETVA